MSASRTGDLLHFTGTLPGTPDAGRGLAAEFDIEVPRAIEVIEVATGAGDIDAAGTPGRIVFRTSDGAITGQDLSGPLEAETRGGLIRIGLVRGAAVVRRARVVL